MPKLIILIFLASINCARGQGLAHEILELDGTAIYMFSRKGSIYWLRSVWYDSDESKIRARMKPDFYSLKSIEQYCPDVILKNKIKAFETDDFRK